MKEEVRWAAKFIGGGEAVAGASTLKRLFGCRGACCWNKGACGWTRGGETGCVGATRGTAAGAGVAPKKPAVAGGGEGAASKPPKSSSSAYTIQLVK